MQAKEETLIDKADEVASGWIVEIKRFIPTIARLCIMASTLEDSLRYWREYGIYINYFGNLWTKQSRSAFMEPDYFLASFFLWPLILKIIPALLLISNLCSRPVQRKLCYFFYFMSLWSMVALQGYPGGRNWNLWQIQHTAKFWAAISLVYAEACEESNSMFAGLPSLGDEWGKKTYLALAGRLLFGFIFISKMQFLFGHWRLVLDWVVNLPCVLAIMFGYRVNLFCCLYSAILLFDNFYWHQFWMHWGNPWAYEHVVYSFMCNMTVIGSCLQFIIYGPGGISLDKALKAE